MITFFRYLYYGLYSYLEAKGKDINRANVVAYSNAPRMIIYVIILIGLHEYNIFTLSDDNKYYVLIIVVGVESILSHVICGKAKHDYIKQLFLQLPEKRQRLFQTLGLVLTPLVYLFCLILFMFLKAYWY